MRENASHTVFSRLNKTVPVAFSVVSSLVLFACTGSSEPRAAGLELVLPVNPTAAVNANIACLTGTVGGPGVVVVDIEQLVPSSGTPTGRCAFQPLASPAFDILTDTRTTRGDSFLVSLPQSARLENWPSSLQASAVVPFTVPSTITDFCPTRIAISPNSDTVAALDDPNVTGSGCATSSRPPRVFVWKRGAPTVAVQPTAPFPFQPNAGPVAIALSDTQLFILSPQAGNYRLTRYGLERLSNATPELVQEAASQSLAALPISGVPNQASLTILGQNLILAYGDGFSGRVFQFAQNATAPGNEFAPGNQAIGPVQGVFTDNRVNDPQQPPTIAFARISTSALRFIRTDQISDTSINARTAIFTPDGFGWVLSTTGFLAQFDLQSLDSLTQSGSVFPNPALRIAGLAWLVNPNP